MDYLFYSTTLWILIISSPSLSYSVRSANILLPGNANVPSQLESSNGNYFKNRSSHTIQRRFMFDDGMESLMQGVANGAKMVKNMFEEAFESKPRLFNFLGHQPSATTTVKYIIKRPIRSSKIKISKVPKKILSYETSSDKPQINVKDFLKKLNVDDMRRLEENEEKKIETALGLIKPSSGIGVFEESSEFKPFPTTDKPQPASDLHTKVHVESPVILDPIFAYEVTENAAEETIQSPHTTSFNTYKNILKKRKHKNFDSIRYISTSTTTTTENPNISKLFFENPKRYEEPEISVDNTKKNSNHSHKILGQYSSVIVDNPVRNRKRHKKSSTEILEVKPTTKSIATRGSVKFGDRL